MSEVTNIPWGKVFSNFVWILGASIILADFSYSGRLCFYSSAMAGSNLRCSRVFADNLVCKNCQNSIVKKQEKKD